ncbi:MAG: hypothetical protein VXZ38_07850 [Planctomycetota bacterium]|nr:hypothetical protein [Planctomycetota bacterium]
MPVPNSIGFVPVPNSVPTAHRRPLLNAMTIRTGPNNGKLLAEVAEHRKGSLESLGR